MNIIKKIIILGVLIGLNNVSHATGSEAVDTNSCRTTSKDWKDMQAAYPGKSLGEVLVQIDQDKAAISAILGGAAGTTIVKALAVQGLVAVNALPTIQPPLPVNYPVYPYAPLDITSDLTQAINQINPGAGTLGAAVATEVTFVSAVSLPPTILIPIPFSSGIIHTDLVQLKDQINPGALTLGAAVVAEVALIDVTSLPPTNPLPIPYPYVSSGIVDTDLVKAIGQVDPTGGVNLGQAVTNVVGKIGIASTHPSTPVILNPDIFGPPYIFDPVPANRASSGIIMGDLNTFNSMLNAAPSATVGGTYQNLLDRLAVLFRDGGLINVPAGTTLPPTLDGILTALGI